MEMYDVIVIGAGPSGSMAARTLGQSGRRVLLLEKGTFPGKRKACGGMLPYVAFDEYGISEDIIETKTEQEMFIFPWYKRTTLQRNAIVQRPIFDEHLALLAKESGAKLLQQCRATAVKKEKDGSLCVETKCINEKREFKCAIVIFADGVHSLAHRTMGIGFKKRRNNVGFGVEYTIEAPNNKLKNYFIFFGLKRLTWGYVWIFPNRNVFNVGVFMLPHDLPEHPLKKEILEHHMEKHEFPELTALLEGKKIVRRIGGHIPLEPAQVLCCDSALVVGDAAGLVFPLTAGGIGTALHSGRLAGAVAGQALSDGTCSEQTLLAYEYEIKNAIFYRCMKKESLAYKLTSPFAHLDPGLYSKLFQLSKLRGELSPLEALKTILFPLLGRFSGMK